MTTDRSLDNPIWCALCTRHRNLATRAGHVARYPPEFAPFLGVAEADSDVDEALHVLVKPSETVLLVGILPKVPHGWQLETFQPLAQMIREAPIPVVDGPPVIELSETHRSDVLALTALVYPHYFRPRTMEMGRYFGIYRAGRLAAMIGERLGTETHTEMSAICTHPDFLGRGYAQRLTAILTNDTLERALTPFLHVSRENARALQLYERLGYHLRRNIGFWALRRPDPDAE